MMRYVICEYSTAVDECKDGSRNCKNGGTCLDTWHSRPKCRCPSFTLGVECEILLIDWCLETPCRNGGTCNLLTFDYTCTCLPGWSGTNCDKDLNACDSSPCQNGAVCRKVGSGFSCFCVSGWCGITCTEYDACTRDVCLNEGTCVDRDDSNSVQYICQCKPGFKGTNCETDTTDACISRPCYGGSTCVKVLSAYKCDCEAGRTGTNCKTDINECDCSPCQNGGCCINSLNKFECQCLNTEWGGPTCDMRLKDKVNQCNSQPCRGGSTCLDGEYAYTCSCTPGWTGSQCLTDVDECGSSPCLNGGSCQNQDNAYRCQCDALWGGNQCEDYKFCTASKPCRNGATCVDLPGTQVGGYSCSCPSGVSGTNCETDLADQCVSNPCLQGSTCFDKSFDYKCVCPPGMTGKTCSTVFQTCSSSPCQQGGACQQSLNLYTCTCPKGWTGTDCEEKDECASHPCENDGVCIDLKDSFTCVCASGHAGSSCQFKKPGQLYHDCPYSVYLHNSLLCECKLSDPGLPPATVGWKDWKRPGSTNVTRTLEIETVSVSDEGNNFICQYTWDYSGISMKELNYTLRIAQGPGDANIIAPDNFTTDGLRPMTLFCNTTSAYSIPRVQWSDVNCSGGNYAAKCTFTPDPTADVGKQVRCTLSNPDDFEDRKEAIYTVNVTWTGVARVKCLEANSSDSNLATGETNAPFKLDCLAIGNPTPNVDVFLQPDTTGAAAAQIKLTDGTVAFGGAEYRRRKIYNGRSPALCQTVHTYRCYASNSKGNHSKSISVRTTCLSLEKAATLDMPIISSVAGLASLVALLVTSAFFIRRWKRKRAMMKSVEPRVREEPEVQMHNDELITVSRASDGLSPSMSSIAHPNESQTETSTASSLDSADVSTVDVSADMGAIKDTN